MNKRIGIFFANKIIMKYILSLLILFSLSYSSSNDYSIIIDEPFNNALLDVTQDYDRDISAIGFIKTYKKNSSKTTTTYTNAFDYLSSLSNEYGSQMHLIKVDNNNANIKIRKTIKLNQFNKAVALLKTSQNGYFVGGYTLDGSLILVKLDSNANIISKTIFGTKNHNKLNNIITLHDGGVLAIGTSVTSRSPHDALFETGLGLNDIYLTRFSKNGKKLWSKKYGTTYDDNGVDAVEANDGSIIVLGQTNYEKYKNLTLMRITENGDKIWLEHYKDEKIVTPHKIIKLKDGNFLASLSQEDDMFKNQIRLIKFNLQKNILIDKNIQTSYSSKIYDIKEYSNSMIIGVGLVQDKYNTDALAILLNNNLDLLDQEHFGDSNYDTFKSVKILHNSQAAIVGIHTNKNSQESNMWITKLNKDLSLAQVVHETINFYEELQKIFATEINKNKINIREDLSIEFSDKDLSFEVGKYTLNTKQKIFIEKFYKKLLPFLHTYQDMIKTLEINGHTSSEWAGNNFTDTYLKNEKLSMNRAYSTLAYIFKNQDKKTQKFLSELLKGSGLSFSQKKIDFYKNEDKEKSRRVSFKIILN